MARWALHCPSCDHEFTYSAITHDTTAGSLWIDAKPEMASTGERLNCPQCKASSLYKRHELVYRAN